MDYDRPKRLLPLLSITLISITFGVLIYMFIELHTSFIANSIGILFTLVISQIFGALFKHFGISSLIYKIWDDMADSLHVAIIIAYATLTGIILFKHVFPMKKQEYDSINQ